MVRLVVRHLLIRIDDKNTGGTQIDTNIFVYTSFIEGDKMCFIL